MHNTADSPKLMGMRQRLATELAGKGIVDQAVLDAMRKVLRHAFVDSALAEKAYEDIPVPIGNDQTISQPFTVAYMTALLQLRPGHKVLEIGTGSGYQAAVLAQMGARVYSIERHRALLLQAKKTLHALGYDSVALKCSDGTLGWPAHAPYHSIIVTAGGPQVPEALPAQLAVGGRMVIPVGDREHQRMVLLTRTSVTDFESKEVNGFRFVPLIGEQGWAS